MLNLIDNHFQNSNLFAHLPILDEIYYLGHPEGKVQKFKAVREDQTCVLFALTLIRKNEDFLWASAEDFLTRSMIEAASRVHGIYTFDLLTFDIHREVKTFNYNELQQLIINHSRKMTPGEQRLVKYSSAYGILQKAVEEHWGKITFKTSVEVFKHQPQQLDTVVRGLFRIAGMPHGPLILLINDLSNNPLFNPNDQTQQKLLKQAIERRAESFIEFPPEVYVQDRSGVRELLSGTVVK